ncbi:MAG: putative peptidoglycan glycosyltransferase FtsW [Coriobacteriales bacterium]|nr:putative lipid II flippase FtsW [Actinomycetes bacterium]
MARSSSRGVKPVYLLLGSTLVLALMGLLMIYSAASVSDYVQRGTSSYHMVRQLVWLLAGGAGMWLASRVDVRFGARRPGLLRDPAALSWGVWAFAVAGLVAVLLFGESRYGAQRWLDLGPISLQPSEFAKLGCVLVTALALAQWSKGQIPSNVLAGRLLASAGVVFLLVMLQPDMGTAVSVVAPVYLLLLLGGVSARVLVALFAGGAAGAAVLVWVASYRLDRLMAFLDPWKDPLGAGFQIIQSLYAFGSGGVGGVGLGLSRQKFFYLPAAHTDFIFAIVGEEFGLIGTLIVVLAFVVFTYAGIRIALQASNEFDRLLAGGITAMIATQAIMNMAAVTGLMPITGIPLPLMSYGGSSLMFTLGCIGLVVGVARRSSREAARARGVRVPATPSSASGAARIHLVQNTAARSSRPQATKGSQGEVSAQRRRNGGSHLPGADRGVSARRRRA